MIDCSKTENFLKEQSRMCIKYRSYPNACRECPLSSWNNKSPKGDLITCCDTLSKEPQKAIEIVQKWSNKHPQKTLLTEFLKHYPNVEMSSDGFPDYILPCILGLVEKKTYVKTGVFIFMTKTRGVVLVMIAGIRSLKKVRKQNEFFGYYSRSAKNIG